ncbi:protein SPIRRIG isoform X1 [Cryptomeria japonica]|uniref:protein SPIRRIG isoform X1 n=1 Tax=Cryptomeria japonica TaxID=3369 RepID=UPI0027DA1085|nr:protein SPIRRIG isoform X1 [Cryptomeria japonica]
MQRAGKTMKWVSLLKDKVGLSHLSSSSPRAPEPVQSPSTAAEKPRDKYELELDFKRFWEEFRSSNSEKEKEEALNMAVVVFCKLAKENVNPAQLLTKLIDAHLFSFVVGKALVVDIGKLKNTDHKGSLDKGGVLKYFTEVLEDGSSIGSSFLYALENLVSPPIDVQPLLDSGVLCCLIQLLHVLLTPTDRVSQDSETKAELMVFPSRVYDGDIRQVQRIEVEGNIVHIMKALASRPGAAQSLIEDDSLQLLFEMVAKGQSIGTLPLHIIQLHRHAVQILGLLLVNDNGSTAKYIHTWHLVKVLLMAVKDFDINIGDASYTMGIVDLLLECVELSYRPEAGGIRLRDDLQNAHGYKFLQQFGLALSSSWRNQIGVSGSANPGSTDHSSSLGSNLVHGKMKNEETAKKDDISPNLPPSLSRLLDVLVNLAQTGPQESISASGGRASKSVNKAGGHVNRPFFTTECGTGEETREKKMNGKVKDLEAVRVLQDIFLKADDIGLQLEVLDRILRIFASHLENYKLCQELRTLRLLILNMAAFPQILQEKILKILEYAVTVVNCVPEQELLSLCCLLQQHIPTPLKHSILSFFVKLLSFDQQYKKVLREVGVLEVLLDDIKKHKFISSFEEQTRIPSPMERVNNAETILSAPRIIGPGSEKLTVFEDEGTISIAWDCLVSLIKKAEGNQTTFRKSNGFMLILPLLIFANHRPGVLRLLSCLLLEDTGQAHPEELGSLIEVLKSGMVTSIFGTQYKLEDDAKCDVLWALWRILGSNNSARRVFCEATGFALLLTVLHSFQRDSDATANKYLIASHVKVFSALLHVVTVAVVDNIFNRLRLHTIISSQTFYDLLCESGLLCPDHENHVVQLMLELSLEIVLSPSWSNAPTTEKVSIPQSIERRASDENEQTFSFFPSSNSSSMIKTEKVRVFNAGAIGVLIRSLLRFSPKLQLEVLSFVEKLARVGSYNQENLTSVGCVGLLLEIIRPFLDSSSPLLLHALSIVEVLGAYRLSPAELRTLGRYILQTKHMASGQRFIEMMERLILTEGMTSENPSLAPFVEMNMSRSGHACLQISLGERSWPPAAGYSFICWFQYKNLVKKEVAEEEPTLKVSSLKRKGHIPPRQLAKGPVLRIFSVGAVDEKNNFCAELCLHADGVLTLATSNSCCLSFPDMQLEEGVWHHLAVVHSKPNALAGLFQSSVAQLYVNGRLRQTGKLGYSASPVGKSLHVTVGTPLSSAEVSSLSWRLGSCYLFEEVLSPSGICFMYVLGRGYRGLFQDTDMLRFVPNEACGGDSLAILDALEVEISAGGNAQRVDGSNKSGDNRTEGSGVVWDVEKLGNFAFQLSGKKLIFAFDGTYSDASHISATPSLLNLVDPMSAAASPMGGIPRFARLHGDVYVCTPCSIGESIRAVGGVAAILALVEAAESKEMLHMALSLLVCALHWNPQNVYDMQACRGYHLLALFLHRRMSLFDVQNLELFFQIASCEASLSVKQKTQEIQNMPASAGPIIETGYENIAMAKFPDEISPLGSQADIEEFLEHHDSLSHMSELENAESQVETLNCFVLSNSDMMEHVLLDWTLWVTAPVSIQISLLNFLERLVSMHRYRNHNLTILRRVNLVQHLLVTLQRGDVEVPVLEKLVVLLGIILEDGFLASELEYVVKFVFMTFDPPEIISHGRVARESMGKHVIVRNMLLEMLIDLQMTVRSEELLEQWHKIVSSTLITYLLDEAVHPTSMRWVMTLLGVCLASSPTFASKFRSNSGYQGLSRVLPSFYDSPEIYYILFCLIFGKPVYPRLPEVRMLDFHALIPSDGSCGELKFLDLLDSVIAMAKATFDRLSRQYLIAQQTGDFSQFNMSMAAELVEGMKDTEDELQGEALMHKTYAARLMSGEAAAPAVATSILRFMVDLAKMCRPFSAECRHLEFLESYVNLYFSCARAATALQLVKGISVLSVDQQNVNESDDTHSSQHTYSSVPQEQEQSAKTSISIGSSAQGPRSASIDDTINMVNYLSENKGQNGIEFSSLKSGKPFVGVEVDCESNSFDTESLEQTANFSAVSTDFSAVKSTGIQSIAPLNVAAGQDSLSTVSVLVPGSPVSSEKSSFKIGQASSMSPVVALTSWLGSSLQSESNLPLGGTPSITTPSVSFSEIDGLQELKSTAQEASSSNILINISPKLLMQMDSAGSGGGPCSAAAGAVLDFIAEILADIMTEQVKATLSVESLLGNVPSYVGIDSVLVFQGLCLSRMMNFLERLILRDEEESEKKLDKNRWSSNLDGFSWMIVDRVYMGAFPEPGGVLKVLEFLLSMLQLSNKDGRIEEAVPLGKSLLSLTRGSRQVEVYVQALLKNTNRMIMYCFLPSFLSTIGEDDILSHVSLYLEPKKPITGGLTVDSLGIDTCTVLQLLMAHKRLIFCPSNSDTDLICCLCVNLIALLWDQRQTVKNMASELIKYLLLNRRAAFEELLVSKPNQGQSFDVLHGGFDKLLGSNQTDFYQWLHSSKQSICRVLEQCASIMWMQYVAGATKFPGVRAKGILTPQKRDKNQRSRERPTKHWEQMSERRGALDLVREAMSTELRVVRQDKYGWVLHAESEWQGHIQQLIHERGIWPMRKFSVDQEPQWQLCPTEGPYRMRKKIEKLKLKVDTIGHFIEDFQEEKLISAEKTGFCMDVNDPDYDSFFHLLSVGGANQKQLSYTGKEDEECFYDEAEEFQDEDASSAPIEWSDDQHSSINAASLHSALEAGGKSSTMSLQMTDRVYMASQTCSPRQSSSQKIDDLIADEKSERDIHDNGEYLIRPYLEPCEKIRFRYNCERVVGLDKHDGIFLIGELCLYVIENFYINDSGHISEKAFEAELSVIDQALGVKSSNVGSVDLQYKAPASWGITAKAWAGGRAWAYNGGAWGKEKTCASGNLPHSWRMWKLESVHELLKREYQLRPVAIELFSMDGCNDLLVFHKKERDEVFKNLVAMNLPRNSMLDTTISGSSKHDSNEGSRLFKIMAKSFCKRWQNGEISNFQYLMHLNTLAGRGYNDLTQYPVFPWVLADYKSETLDMTNPNSFRKLDKPIGCQTAEGEEEFKKRYESWDDPDVPKFHYGSHYSSAGIVLFYLIRLPPFSIENQKLQGGQFDHADRLFNSVKDTWFSAAGKSNTSDVKELIPEFFYMPEFLENRFHLDLGVKQSGEKVDNVVLPPWAKGSAREFIRKHREALESEYVSEHLHHWIDLIFGHRQRGKAAEEATNVFYHYTYEGSVDIDAVSDPAMKASILAQINHFGQTPRQLFFKPHVKRRCQQKHLVHALRHSSLLAAHEVRNTASAISQIVNFHDKILVAGLNCLLKPRSYTKYIAWGFSDRSLRFLLYDQEKLISTHEALHGGSQVQCAGISRDGRILVTGGDDGVVLVWRLNKDGTRGQRRLHLQRALCAHTGKITCIAVCQPYSLIVSGSEDCTVIFWDLSSLEFVRQLPELSAPASAVHANELTGEVVTAAGTMLAVWSINGDCLATVNTSQLPSDFAISVTSSTFSDWMETNWYVTGHQSGAVKVWHMVHVTEEDGSIRRQIQSSDSTSKDSAPTVRSRLSTSSGGLDIGFMVPEYHLILFKVLKSHKHPVTAVHLSSDLKQLLSGDASGRLLSWTLPDENSKNSSLQEKTL